ncbi:hypothetical protein [Clostridium perfringens]|uniref:hypothetical protein n=1 Tax=Clostridium perfringens TaxID=1502 RepID=UPI0024BCFBCC|nr:hypothetical protein [Clostridium perfringens]
MIKSMTLLTAYLSKYISLIENYELDIREEMVFVESKLNKYNNELLNYYMNFFASILSGVCCNNYSIYN